MHKGCTGDLFRTLLQKKGRLGTCKIIAIKCTYFLQSQEGPLLPSYANTTSLPPQSPPPYLPPSLHAIERTFEKFSDTHLQLLYTLYLFLYYPSSLHLSSLLPLSLSLSLSLSSNPLPVSRRYVHDYVNFKNRGKIIGKNSGCDSECVCVIEFNIYTLS
jgi:hypothetical protein